MATGNSIVETSGKKKKFTPLLDFAKTREQGAAWADEYFKCLKKQPESVELAGVIDDLIDPENSAPLDGFCEKLQELIDNSIPRKGVEISILKSTSSANTHKIDRDSFDDAMTLISEVEAVIDLLGEIAPNADGLGKHTLQSSCILAGRLLTEASEKLNTEVTHG